MRALVFENPWQMSLQDVADPEPQAGEVLLRVEATGICGSDVHGFTGESGRRKPGMVMGHETCGTVMAVGPGVSGWKVGDRAVTFIIDACGKCAACISGEEQLCPSKRVLGVNAGHWGAMAERMVCPAKCLFRISGEIPGVIAALTEPVGIAVRAVKLSGIQPGQAAMIVGCGTIAMTLALVLRERGVEIIHVLGRSEWKLDLARGLGAMGVNVKDCDPLSAVEPADVVFEAMGQDATVRQGFDLTRPGGTLMLVGNLAQTFTLPLQAAVSRETVIRGTYAFNRADFAEAVALVGRVGEKLRPIVSATCSLGEVPHLITQLAREEMRAVKVIMEPGRKS